MLHDKRNSDALIRSSSRGSLLGVWRESDRGEEIPAGDNGGHHGEDDGQRDGGGGGSFI